MVMRVYKLLEQYSLVFSLIILTGAFFVFYPTRSIAVDEYDYQRNAQLILRGQLRQRCDSTNIPSQFSVDGEYCISKYNIGTSILLIPGELLNQGIGDLSLGSWQLNNWSFAVTFLVFVSGIALFHLTLSALGLSPIWTYLYAFYPTFVYYSRTLYSETFSATLILFTFYILLRSYLQDQPFMFKVYNGLAGAGAGMAVWVRYSNALPLAVMIGVFTFLAFWPASKAASKKNLAKAWQWLWPIILGGLPFVMGLLLFNNYLYGAPLRSGYFYSGEEGLFIWEQVPLFLARFIGLLSILYPGMVWTLLFIKDRFKWALTLPAFVTILLYSAFPSTFFEGRILDLIFGVRFLVPVIPLLLVGYAVWLENAVRFSLFAVRQQQIGNMVDAKSEKRIPESITISIIIFGIFLLIGLTIALTYLHQQFLLTASLSW